MATSKDPELRLLVVGKTGQGKSSTCNSIIGHDHFEASASSTSTTDTCSWHKEQNRFGMTIEVVDTPGFYDTDRSNSTVHKELIKSLLLTTPGFHAIAFVLMMGEKFTPEMQKTKDLFFKWFGPGVENFSFVILTDTDSKKDLEKFLQNKPHPKLMELIRECGNRVVPLQSRTFNEQLRHEQVCDILQMIKQIKAMNNNECFSNMFYAIAQSYAEERAGRFSRESMHPLTNAGIDPNSLTEIQRDCIREAIGGCLEIGNRRRRHMSSTTQSYNEPGRKIDLTLFAKQDHRSTSVSAASDAPDSIELMKNNVNNDKDNQEIFGLIAFVRKWIPSKCKIL